MVFPVTGHKNMNSHDIHLTRRHFLALTGSAAGSLILGCAVNPVTGRQQLMLVSEGEEKQIDRVNSPHQFSADYGPIQDKQLSDYIADVGRSVSKVTHRTNMPYRFIPLNAAYVNAYTFPAGSIGITRGILLELENEAALAALIGHELGHVNARHTAQAMSKGVLASLALAGLSSAASDLGSGAEQLAGGLGQIAAGALLASYRASGPHGHAPKPQQAQTERHRAHVRHPSHEPGALRKFEKGHWSHGSVDGKPSRASGTVHGQYDLVKSHRPGYRTDADWG
jgi:hypothetical protein